MDKEFEKLCERLDEVLEGIMEHGGFGYWKQKADAIREAVDETRLQEFVAWFDEADEPEDE